MAQNISFYFQANTFFTYLQFKGMIFTPENQENKHETLYGMW